MGDFKSNEYVAALFARHGPLVRALAFRYAPMPGFAEDIVQQVFTELLEKREQWDCASDLRPLLHSLTKFIAQRLWRERANQMPSELRQLAEHIQRLAEDRQAEVYEEEQKQALRRCLAKLPGKSQRLLEAHYVLGISSAEVAGRMQLKPDAVRQALCRLRARLRKCMERASMELRHA